MDQASIDRDHPQCKNICGHLKCRSLAKLGEECKSDDDCGAENRCADKKCVAGRIAVGKPCQGGSCVDGARCLDGACQLAHKEGEACETSTDCATGGCVLHRGQTKGVCGMKCALLPLP
jgi:hypothetical protein